MKISKKMLLHMYSEKGTEELAMDQLHSNISYYILQGIMRTGKDPIDWDKPFKIEPKIDKVVHPTKAYFAS
jgi:hypothetical protein